MPVCARAIQEANGTLSLALDPTVTDLSTCAYVVQTGAELGNSLVSFSAADGALLSSGVVGCWVAAYAIRSVYEIIRGSANETG